MISPRGLQLALLFLLVVPACGGNEGPLEGGDVEAKPEGPKGVDALLNWEFSHENLRGPEAAHVVGDYVYFSQMRDVPGETGPDGDGYISRLALDGSGYVEQWATGFNSPKGLRAAPKGKVLWVADVDRLVAVSLGDGSWSDKTTVVLSGLEGLPDAELLNDVAIGPNGTVYASDTFGNLIYAVTPGKPEATEVFGLNSDLDHPNGLLVERDTLLVASWGSPLLDKKTFATGNPGRLTRYALGDGEVLFQTELIGNLDGVESDGRGNYLVTDWVGGNVLRVDGQTGKHEIVRPLGQGAADLGFVAATGQVIVPVTAAQKVVSFFLDPAAN